LILLARYRRNGAVDVIHALLNGKLSRDYEHLEDVLTSNVFGLLRYLNPSRGLLQFLSYATSLDSRYPVRHLAELPDAKVSLEFWPRWNEPDCRSCEPDVVIRIDSIDEPLLICVEAKYRSGKSSLAEEGEESATDQLAKEWANLSLIARREGRKPLLIFLTTDISIPVKDLEDSTRNVLAHDPLGKPEMLWLSWMRVEDATTPARNTEGVERRVADDLMALLERLGLQMPKFEGVAIPQSTVPLAWSFAHESR